MNDVSSGTELRESRGLCSGIAYIPVNSDQIKGIDYGSLSLIRAVTEFACIPIEIDYISGIDHKS